MIVKGIALTIVATTPLALFVNQDPQQPRQPERIERPAESSKGDLLRAKTDLQRAQAELKAARRDLSALRGQLEAALDRLDQSVEPERERNCSPSRSRQLMSHYQWLRGQGHEQRADATVAKIVERVGDDAGRLNSTAWSLMTDKDTAGKFDELALAFAKRMEAVAKSGNGRRRISYNYLDTAALAHFLNGNVEQAIKLQEQAIASGGSNDDFRRRLRTYQAARVAVAEATRGLAAPEATLIASAKEDEDDEE